MQHRTSSLLLCMEADLTMMIPDSGIWWVEPTRRYGLMDTLSLMWVPKPQLIYNLELTVCKAWSCKLQLDRFEKIYKKTFFLIKKGFYSLKKGPLAFILNDCF